MNQLLMQVQLRTHLLIPLLKKLNPKCYLNFTVWEQIQLIFMVSQRNLLISAQEELYYYCVEQRSTRTVLSAGLNRSREVKVCDGSKALSDMTGGTRDEGSGFNTLRLKPCVSGWIVSRSLWNWNVLKVFWHGPDTYSAASLSTQKLYCSKKRRLLLWHGVL
jgi:hypothetical protein